MNLEVIIKVLLNQLQFTKALLKFKCQKQFDLLFLVLDFDVRKKWMVTSCWTFRLILLALEIFQIIFLKKCSIHFYSISNFPIFLLLELKFPLKYFPSQEDLLCWSSLERSVAPTICRNGNPLLYDNYQWTVSLQLFDRWMTDASFPFHLCWSDYRSS